MFLGGVYQHFPWDAEESPKKSIVMPSKGTTKQGDQYIYTDKMVDTFHDIGVSDSTVH